MTRRAPHGTTVFAVRVPVALRAALEVEAWESGLSLSEYVAGLLERRGKWARSVGKPGGYDLISEGK
jgi:predicted HicB family RNase H-like nuclease